MRANRRPENAHSVCRKREKGDRLSVAFFRPPLLPAYKGGPKKATAARSLFFQRALAKCSPWPLTNTVSAAPEARKVWQWYNCVRDVAGAQKPLLHVNLDETAVCQWMRLRYGNVLRKRGRNGSPAPRATVPRGPQRRYVTFLASICDNAEVQARLPQIVVLAEGAARVHEVAELNRDSAANHICLRRKSAWMNTELFEQAVDTVLQSMGAEVRKAYHIVLFFDTASPHLGSKLFARCKREGVSIVIVPSLMTGILQPLDTHVFSRYKGKLSLQYSAAQVAGPGHVLPMPQVVRLIWSAWQETERSYEWGRAFAANGFSFQQQDVCSRVLGEVGLPEAGAA